VNARGNKGPNCDGRKKKGGKKKITIARYSSKLPVMGLEINCWGGRNQSKTRFSFTEKKESGFKKKGGDQSWLGRKKG